MRHYRNHNFNTFGLPAESGEVNDPFPQPDTETLYTYPDGTAGAGAPPAATIPPVLQSAINAYINSTGAYPLWRNEGESVFRNPFNGAVYYSRDEAAGAAGDFTLVTFPRSTGVETTNTTPVDTEPQTGNTMPTNGGTTTTTGTTPTTTTEPESTILGFPTKTVLIGGGIVAALVLSGGGK
jgi:hypothetical protein